MTDKQVIVDGVDISGCPYYIDSDGSCSSHDCECIKCIHNVCFYKDYKAKEQECEELKHKVELMMDCASCKVDEYKQTLAEIKEMCNSVKNIENVNSLYDAKLSGMYLKSRQILQKISECEVEDAR